MPMEENKTTAVNYLPLLCALISAAKVTPAGKPDENGDGRATATAAAYRRRLPQERRAMVHHFSVGGQEGYLTVGLYEEGQPGEMFLRMSKEGATVSGLMDAFATAISLCLQYGVPLKVLCDKFSHTRFEPSGWSGNPHIGYAKSLTDYIFRWLELRFLKKEQKSLFGEVVVPPANPQVIENDAPGVTPLVHLGDAPTCTNCGSLMSRSGSCYTCGTCGNTSGCS
jgi:ribonucleoside-diphosphate reductase alpha chain